MINIIWEVELSIWFRVRNFRNFARVSKVNFQSLFKELENENIENLMKILRIFILLHSFPQRMNEDLEVEAKKDNLKVILTSFNKENSPSANG